MPPTLTHPADADDTSNLDGYTWPTCTHCGRGLLAIELGRYACRICQRHAAENLGTIRTHYPALTTTGALIPATSSDRTRTGARTTAPAPVNIAVLNLTTNGGIATRLQAVEDAWRTALARRHAAWSGTSHQAVAERADFLTAHLGWACENYPEIAQDLDEIRALAAQCKGTLLTALDPAGHTPGPVRIGHCPAPLGNTTTPCGAPLTATPNAHTIRCTTCGASWDGILAWAQLRRAQNAVTAALAA